MFVQFSDATETVISAVFGGPQDPTVHPNQGEVDVTDARYAAFYATLPSAAQRLLTPPATMPAPTLAQQAQAMLLAGLAITSTATPLLNATYGLDPQSISDVQSEVISILLQGTFTNGETTLAWPDIAGAMHTFTIAQFKPLATALAAFVTALKPIIATNSGTLPAATAAIP